MIQAKRITNILEWYGVGFVGQDCEGKSRAVKMVNADMAVCTVNDMEVHDYHGREKNSPTRDTQQSFVNVGSTVSRDDPDITRDNQDVRTWWFTRPREAQDSGDEEIAKGSMMVLWAVGNMDFAGKELSKHPLNGRRG